MGGIINGFMASAHNQRREPKGEIGSDDSEEEEEDDEEEESSDEEQAAGPVIANENPNVVKKPPIKASQASREPQELSRRERYAKPSV